MGVQVRQKGGKWYVFMNHQGQRKAKCIGSDKRVAVQVQKQLEAKLALGDVELLEEAPEAILFGDYAEQWLDTYIKITIDIYGHPRQGTNTYLADRLDRGGELTQHSATQMQPIGNMVA